MMTLIMIIDRFKMDDPLTCVVNVRTRRIPDRIWKYAQQESATKSEPVSVIELDQLLSTVDPSFISRTGYGVFVKYMDMTYIVSCYHIIDFISEETEIWTV